MDAKLIDPSTFQKAPRKLRGSAYDSLIEQIRELPADKGILVPVPAGTTARTLCSRLQTGLRALLQTRGITVQLSLAPSADGKSVLVTHRGAAKQKAEKPKPKPKPKAKAPKAKAKAKK
jgi:hypothetical protein